MTWAVEAIKHNLYWLLAIGQPLVFFLGNLYFKIRFGQRDFRFLGGDLALCGCAVFWGTALRQILLHRLDDPAEIVANVILLGVSLGIWVLCLELGKGGVLWRSFLATCIGLASFFLCDFSPGVSSRRL